MPHSPFDVDVTHLFFTKGLANQVHLGGIPDDAAQFVPAAMCSEVGVRRSLPALDSLAEGGTAHRAST